ncbi:MAG: HEAT repeat domain-containing protein [Acidobacteriota bacterium]
MRAHRRSIYSIVLMATILLSQQLYPLSTMAAVKPRVGKPDSASLISDLRKQMIAELKSSKETKRINALKVLTKIPSSTNNEKVAISTMLDDSSSSVVMEALNYFEKHPSATALPKIWRKWQETFPLLLQQHEGNQISWQANKLMQVIFAHYNLPSFINVKADFINDLHLIAQYQVKTPWQYYGNPGWLAISLLIVLGEAKQQDFPYESYNPNMLNYFYRNGEQLKTPVWSDAQAWTIFQEAVNALADNTDGMESKEALLKWVQSVSLLAEHNSRQVFPFLLNWVESVKQKDDVNNLQWSTAIYAISRLAVPSDAGQLLELWKQTSDQKRAYDIAWILGKLAATQELALQLDHSEAWRREQVALILYGHSERLTLEQAGKILATRQLCRYQQLWLITRVVRATHPTADELATFLSKNNVIPSPELLYELRNASSEWVAEQIHAILTDATSDEHDRARLIAMLTDFNMPNRDQLIEIGLADASAEVRAAALSTLSRLNQSKALNAAQQLKNDKERSVLYVLQRLSGIAETDLQLSENLNRFAEETLYSDELSLAVEWILELGEARDVRAVTGLIQILANSNEPQLRTVAAQALGGIAIKNDQRILTVLRGALSDNNESVKLAVIQALGRLGDKEDATNLIPYLYQEIYTEAVVTAIVQVYLSQNSAQADISELNQVIDALPWIARTIDSSVCFYALARTGRADLIPKIVEAAFAAGEDEEIDAAATALATLDKKQSLRLLQSIASSGSADERYNAIRLLNSISLRDISNLNMLIEALSYQDDSVQEESLHALAILRDRRAVTAIKKLLKKADTSSSVREAAYEALLFIEPESVAFEGNLDRLGDVGRLMAVYSLSRVNGPMRRKAQLQLLKSYYSDENIWQRGIAAAGLIQMGDEQASNYLLDLAPEAQCICQMVVLLYPLGNIANERGAALQAMVKKIDEKGEGWREIQPIVRSFSRIVQALAGDPEASQALLDNLSSDNLRDETEEVVTAFEILTLGARPAPSVVESLLNIVNRGETKPNYNFVSGAAVMALGDLGDTRALPALRRARLSIDPLISFYAANAMYKLADIDWTLELLASRVPQLATAGIYISERFSDAAVTEALIKNLSHVDWRVRGYAAYMLGRRLAGRPGQLQAETKLSALAVKDNSLQVRDEARAALKHIANPKMYAETYFEAGLLLEWVGLAKTGFDDLLPFHKFLQRFQSLAGVARPILPALRSVARGQARLYTEHGESALETLYIEFVERALTLHLLGEARPYDAFAITAEWAAQTNLQGTPFEEAKYAALSVLLGELGDERGLQLLQTARQGSREWLVRYLIDIGEEKIAAAYQRRKESAVLIKSKNPTQQEITAALGGWADQSSLNTRVQLQFTDLRKGKSYLGEGRLLWEGFERLRLRVYSPMGTTIADLALKDATMELAIYYPVAQRRLLRGTIPMSQRPSEDFTRRAGAFAALRPEHLLSALRATNLTYREIKNVANNIVELAVEPTDRSTALQERLILQRNDLEWQLLSREWRDSKSRLVMRVSYHKPFKAVSRHGVLGWCGEVLIERPQDGYQLKLKLPQNEMKMAEKLPDNAFQLNLNNSLPIITLQ